MSPQTHISSLADAHALVVGVGGLGAPCSLALADAGIGRLTLVDPDDVEVSNLHRQPLYDDADLGRQKVQAAAAHLRTAYPATVVIPIAVRFDAASAPLLQGVGVVIDATDTVAAKFIVNDAAVAADVPLVHAGAISWQAQLLTVLPGRSACYRCVFEDAPPPEDTPSCDAAGVLGPAVAFAGTLQAAEALRVLRHEPLLHRDRLLWFDLSTGRTRHVPVARRAGCIACDVASTRVAGRSSIP